MSTTTELVPSVSITNLLSQRAAVLERIDRALQLLQEADEIATQANIGFPTIEFSGPGNKYRERGLRGGVGDLQALSRHAIDSDGWRYLMSQTGLRTFMDAEARKEWDKSLSEGKFPELNASNIAATFELLHGARGEMFDRGVIASFKALSWVYATNLPQMFGKRIVVRYITSPAWGGANYDTCNVLDDLSRCFHVLDGKPEPDHRNGWYGRVAGAAKATGRLGNALRTETEDDYLEVRTFKNGNGHVTFKRPDLVEKMNLILARHYPNALAAPRGK